MTRNDRMTSDDRMTGGERMSGNDQMTGGERMSGGDRMASGERMAGDGRDDDDRHGAWPWDRPQPSNDAHAPYQRKPEPPATGRATASARVAPPSEAKRTGPPYTEFTTDVAGRGRPEEGDRAAEQQEPYSEHTTDISGRGRADQHPYVPAPALPSMHAAPPLTDGFPSSGQKPPPGIEGDRLRMGGVFPGPPGRATVSPPPGPEQAASWPGAPAGAVEDSRFEQFRPEAEAPAAKPETPHVRTLPVLIGVIIAAALLVGAAFGLVYLISGDSDNAGLQVSVGDCVKKDGEAATTAACTDEGAFQVASIADSQDKCADPQQPYVVDPTSDGRTRVLCLKPVV
jgi:collagen type III alpha